MTEGGQEKKSTRNDGRVRILLVEDSLEIAQMIIALLSSANRYQITVAQDGIRGLRLALSQTWELLISDLNLPGKDGLELIREVRAARPDMPILGMTGYTRPHYFARALENGADAVLPKPLERDEFLAAVRELASRATRRGPTAAERAAETTGGGVLAVGAYPGDVEVGCGGTLLGHAALGQSVTIAVVSGVGEDGEATPGGKLAERAALRLPAAFRVMDPLGDPLSGGGAPEAVVSWIAKVVREVDPSTVYAPSSHESQRGRVAAHRAAVEASEGAVPNVLAYQSATATVDFRPGLFVNVGGRIEAKATLLSLYLAAADRSEFTEESVRVSARYWGRFARNRLVEPLEVVRGGSWRAAPPRSVEPPEP